MRKVGYLLVVFVYVAIIGLWCDRFPLSFRMTNGTNHALVLDHDFSNAERAGEEQAYRIRQTLSAILLLSSVLVFGGTYILLRMRRLQPRRMAKVVMIVAGIISCLLILVNGIHFIPGPPIR